MDAPRAVAREVGRRQSSEDMLAVVLAAASDGNEGLRETLETLSAPIYVTDAEGWVTSYNSACIDFVGRTPDPGEDRWCVTWRLYTEQGERLAHDECPMAVAIREARPVRNVVAVAERPDGTRVMFLPHPTPIFDADGRVTGAVNLLVDVTDRQQADALDVQAARCRRLAQTLTDSRTVETLGAMAAEYEEKARKLRG